ncbi:hypothetical protein ACMWHH_08145 [Klebsiella pneumoniae]|uniref:hypothetical protein n=1 Tax=Klebsiella pneumoniae TaxID=573 RepID=UPI000E2A4824|nr:hypothetical protein [Klebsiella pneumoniae]MDZ6239459.1 hypothetical protein [Klebsiella pneumoniae]SXK93268.1 Uncharacterised protein [Klebsiella pneumoniae]
MKPPVRKSGINQHIAPVIKIDRCNSLPYIETTLDSKYRAFCLAFIARRISQVLIQHGGGTELATLRGKSLITEDGEAIEGEALDDVNVIGVVTFTICDVRQDNAVV